MISLKDFIETDLTTLPTDVLTSINIAISNELSTRRIENKKKATHSKFLEHRFIKQKVPTRHWGKYYDELLEQDWSHLFKGGDLTPKYYVYAHINPSEKSMILHEERSKEINFEGTPFYIGKGCNDRAYDLKRNQGHGEILKSLKKSGYNQDKIVKILFENLTEDQAFEIESKLIYFFGTIYERGRHGMLVNLDIPARPDFTREA